MFVDSHCHLDFPDFADEIPATIARAEAAGVTTLLTICTHLSKFSGVLSLAEKFGSVWCSVGIHPHEAEHEDLDTAEPLVVYAQHPRVVAFGETGLDCYYEHSPRALQERKFRLHIDAARQMDLPVIIHTRDAEDDTLRILRDEMEKGPFRGVIHCFSASRAFGEAAIDLGLYLSISGIITFKKADLLRETVQALPLERMLVETDAPYLAPMPMRGKRNEPAFTALTASKLAEIKDVSMEDVGRITSDNFFSLFSKVCRPISVDIAKSGGLAKG